MLSLVLVDGMGSGELLFLEVCRLLIAMASPVGEHRLQTQGLSSCSTQASLLLST